MKGRPVNRRRALHIAAVAGVGSVFGGGVLAELVRQGRLYRVTGTRPALGTLVTFTLSGPSKSQAQLALDGAFARVETLERVLSRHRPDTPLSVLNRTGRLENPPEDLRVVLTEASRLAHQTDGAFDVTVGPLLALYEGSYAGGSAPTKAAVEEALSRVGHRSLLLDEDHVRFARPGMAVTLDGIAKGYVVDRTVEHLVRVGFTSILVDAGGDIASRGGARGRVRGHWTVAVADPPVGRDRGHLVQLADGACIATSGDYMQPFTADRRHHPILDPRTGTSPPTVSAATVVSKSAMRSDALSTAAMILGPMKGVALLEEADGVEGLITHKDGSRTATAGWGPSV